MAHASYSVPIPFVQNFLKVSSKDEGFRPIVRTINAYYYCGLLETTLSEGGAYRNCSASGSSQEAALASTWMHHNPCCRSSYEEIGKGGSDIQGVEGIFTLGRIAG